jgi:hypothetical protein
MKLLCKVIFFLVIVGHGKASLAQQKGNKPGTELSIRKAKGAITLDGKLDEQDWKDAGVATNFFLNYPVDTAAAPFKTEARLTFDDHALYLSFVCFDDGTPDIVQSLRRDFDYVTNDNVGVILGPYNDALNGFYFVITPQGIQLEGTIAGGGADDAAYNPTWDNKWYSKVVKLEDRWVAELMIPFKSFRYKGDVPSWNITFQRYDLKRNLVSCWIATPIQFFGTSFAYSGNLVWADHPPQHTTNISLIPYLAGGSSKDNATDPATKTNDLQAGFDAKVAVTPSLNLDLTVNPDFSQVEVDRQVINLTRFEFQFPERRQFFLENSDLFDRMGWPAIRPFFSRRIGLAKDSTGLYKKVPILYGARLSGSLSGKWRMSVLNMQTNEKLSLGLPSQNFTVVAIQKNFWKQSNFQVSFVNKESLGVGEGDTTKYFNEDLWKEKVVGSDTVRKLNNFNRVLTLDAETRSVDNTWYSSVFLSQSFDSFTTSDRLTGGGFVQYTKRNLQIAAGQTWLQKNYNSEAGFVPSHGVYPGVANSFASIYGSFYPGKGLVAKSGPGLDLNLNIIPGGTVVDKSAALQYNINFLSTATLTVFYLYNFQEMTNSFNPIDGEKYSNYLPGEQYTWNRYSIFFQSNQRRLFRYALGAARGGFYNGDNLNLNGELNFRYQPYGSVSIRFDYNGVKLPGNYGSEKLLVVSPRFDLTFTSKIFLTTFVQYNTLLENVNLNARLQWRYKPASDFFVVYTENYLPETFGSKNRALVFKFTYWLNI